jgi:hypothetical protein
MTGSINKSQTEFPNNLQSKGRSKSRTNPSSAVVASKHIFVEAKVGTTFCEYSCIPVNAIVGVGVMRMISPR